MNTVPMDVRDLHARLGKVFYQPVDVRSFTNKRLTVNFRVPLDKLRQLVPPALEVEEIGNTGLGLISQCVCDFHVTHFGPMPIPKTHTNEMLLRISVKIKKGGETYRAYYTLRSDSSSRLLAFLGGNFSHFRKARSEFEKCDDGEIYQLTCRAEDSLCNGYFRGYINSLSKETPTTTIFKDVQAATDFIYQLTGSCGYSYQFDRLSLQKIQFPEWDLYFCHEYEYDFGLLNYLFEAYDLQPELDCVLFMEKIPQVWGTSWLYRAGT